MGSIFTRSSVSSRTFKQCTPCMYGWMGDAYLNILIAISSTDNFSTNTIQAPPIFNLLSSNSTVYASPTQYAVPAYSGTANTQVTTTFHGGTIKTQSYWTTPGARIFYNHLYLDLAWLLQSDFYKNTGGGNSLDGCNSTHLKIWAAGNNNAGVGTKSIYYDSYLYKRKISDDTVINSLAQRTECFCGGGTDPPLPMNTPTDCNNIATPIFFRAYPDGTYDRS